MADTATPAKGVLPKNLQTWVIIGLTLLVVAVIALAGNGKPKPAPGTAAAPAASAEPPLDQYAQRLEQLKADTERAQQEALVAQQNMMALAQPPSPVDPTMMPTPVPTGAEDDVRKLQAKREYTSLFASQLVRSYRAGGATAAEPAEAVAAEPLDPYSVAAAAAAARREPGGSRLEALDQQLQGLGAQIDAQEKQLIGAAQQAQQQQQGRVAGVEASRPEARPSTMGRNQTTAEAQHYLIFEGSVLEAALLTRINSDFAGPVIVQVSTPVYSRNRQHLLVPSGSRVIGEAKRTEAFGQTRLAVVFHRLLMPDGYSVDLDQFAGISSRGESALSDQVNHHYLRIFGASIAVGVLGGLSSMGTNGYGYAAEASASDQFRQGAGGSFGQSATRILDKFLNILPTITIREGHRVRVWFNQDLALPAYGAHAMPKDL